jgi:methionyl-tRNA formyltransferase
MDIIFIGRGVIAFNVLCRLVEESFNVRVVGVSTRHTQLTGGGANMFKEFCSSKGIPVKVIDNINNQETISNFKKIDADYGVCIQWPKMLGQGVIETTQKGFLNYHASHLPKYRGNSSNNWAIIQGEPFVGVTAHLMLPDALDNGHIVLQKCFDLTSETSIKDVIDFYTSAAPSVVTQALKGLEQGTIDPKPQKEEDSLRSYSRLPRDGEIDWNQSAIAIDRLVRAVSAPYPGAYTFYKGEKLRISKVKPLKNPPDYIGVPGHIVQLNADGTVWVLAGRDDILIIEEIDFGELKKIKPGKIIKSIKDRLGLDTSDEIMLLKSRIQAFEDRLSALEKGKKL